MKLAEALMIRADLQRKLAQLQTRLNQSAQYQEGEAPAEEPQSLLRDYLECAKALEALVIQINRANQQAVLADGTSMLEALALRDRLKAEQAMFASLAQAAVVEQNRYSRSEIKMIAAVDIKQIRKQADDVAKQYRQLDVLIQQANWQFDL